MPTLELTIQRKTDSGYPVAASLTRPGGFLPLRREGLLNLDIPALPEFQYDPLAYGTVLGQALFVDEIRDTFREGLAGGESLRVLLSIEAPDLRAIDWHRLAAPFAGRWRFLASQQNTPFSLSVPSPASAHFPALGRRDLRALLLVAGPESLSGDYKLAPFDVAATIAGIQATLGDIPCDILSNPSLDALCAALTATPYTLLHLVCHGVVNQSGETILYFPKDENKRPTPATDLLNRLGSLARLPHFAFVSACESALPQNGLGSLAGRLVRELGLPAVLAMTDRVSIATASAIAAPFYAHLYQHGQPDLALAQSLAGMQGTHDLTVPAIFSRLGDRPLFDDNSERALSDNELEFGLAKLAESLPERAPVMDSLRDALTRRLRSTLGADVHSLSESRRTERKESLDQLNSLSLEALDLSFNALCLGQTPPAYDSRSPFRGLESFRPEDAPYFFGREALTKKLVQKLNEHNFLAVLGASGSGKSSLVMAGLIPALNVPHAVFRPGAEPLAELDKALQADPQLLVVDQFEELFTLSAREQRALRADFISRLLEQSQRLRVVITLRADFLGEVAPFKSLKDEVQNHQEIIPPMDEAELRRAMEGQAGCAGLRFESDLSQQMLDDVSGEPGAMPLLQHALWTLWTRRHGRWLRAEEYRAFGGVRQAIASTAEAVFARCTDFEKERLRDIFLRLTRLDDSADGRDTRRRVLLRDLIPADSDPAATTLLIKQLADARLLVVTGNEVEVAHEALIRHWERLRTWLNDDRDSLRLREGVSDDARRWENAKRDESLLNHRGPHLELALAMSRNPRYRLNPVEQAYLDGCVDLIEREKTAITKRRRYIFAFGATALATILILLAGWSWTSNENSKQLGYQVATATHAQGFAQQQAATAEAAKATAVGEANTRATAQAQAIEKAQIARAGELAAQSQILSLENGVQTIQSGLLAIEAAHRGAGFQADQALRRYLSLAASPLVRIYCNGHINALAFSQNGGYAIIGSGDGIARILELPSGNEISHFSHRNEVTAVAFHPNMEQFIVASGSKDGTVVVWDAQTSHVIAENTHTKRVTVVEFSRDGQYILSSSDDGIARVWIASTGTKVAQVSHQSPIDTAAFSPDGNYVITGSYDGTIRVWDSKTGTDIFHINIGQRVFSASFSPDGQYIASGSYDGKIQVWNVKTWQKIAEMSHAHIITKIAFSPNSRYIVSGSYDRTARVWDMRTGNEIAHVSHQRPVSSVAFTPDGNHVVSGSYDGTARVWESRSGNEISHISHNLAIYAVAISPDGKYLMSGGEDNIVQIWNPQSENEFLLLPHDDTVTSIAFSKDNRFIVSASYDRTVRVWNAITGQEVSRTAFEDRIIAVAFNPDNRTIAAGDEKGIIRIWDVATKSEVAQLLYPGKIWSVVFSSDGQYLASGVGDSKVYIWDVKSRKEIAYMQHDGPVYTAVFSPNGKYIVSSSEDNTAKVWEISSGKEIAHMTHAQRVLTVAVSRDGEYVASGSYDGVTKVWDLQTGREIMSIPYDRSTNSVSFSPDGKQIGIGSDDGIVRIWDLSNHSEVARMNHKSVIWSIAFSPDGGHIGSAGEDNSIRVWYLHISDLIEVACHHLPRNFLRVEWNQYFPDETYIATCSSLPLEPEPTATPSP